MDSLNNISSSKAYTSLGLLDEHLLEESPFNSNRIRLSKLDQNKEKEIENEASPLVQEQPIVPEPICINETEIKELENEFSRFSDANEITSNGDDCIDDQDNIDDVKLKGELSSRFFKAQDLTSNDHDSLSTSNYEHGHESLNRLSVCEKAKKTQIKDEKFENNYSLMKERFMKETHSLLKSINLTSNSLFDDQTGSQSSSSQLAAISKEASQQFVDSSQKRNTSLSHSILFKSQKDLLNESVLNEPPKKENQNESEFGEFKNFNFHDKDAVAQEALFTDQQFGFSFEFKSSEEILNQQLEVDTSSLQNKDIEQSWSSFNLANQPSKLNISSVTLANSSLNLTTKKVPVDDYFNRKSTFPSTFDVNNGDRSLVNFKKEMESNKNQAQIPHRDIDESQNVTLMETTSDNCFSFTINASDHGEALVSKKPVNGQTEKSKFNLKDIGDNLNRISKFLEERANLAHQPTCDDIKINLTNESLSLESNESHESQHQSQQQSNMSKNAKNKSKLTGSITSTPAKNQSSNGASKLKSISDLPKSASQMHLFNQESFISSIPDANTNDVTIQSSISTSSNDSNSRKVKKFEVTNSNKQLKRPNEPQQTVEIQTSPPNKQQDQLLSNLVSGLSNTSTNSLLSSVSTGASGVVPVALLPANAVIPYMLKFYEDCQKLDPNNQQQQSFTNITKNFFSSVASERGEYSFESKRQSFQHLPRIELDTYNIDFGQIAEGCQANHLLKISTIDDDYDGQNYYIIEISENAFKIDSRNDEICARLRKILSLNKEATCFKLKFKKMQELNVSLNTCDLKIFGHLTTDQRPINIQTQILVYFAFGNTDRKYLLNKLDVRLQLGYVRLKTYSTIDSIDFQIDKYFIESTKKVKIDIPHGSVQKLLPISNAGNIPATLDCYFLDDISLYGFRIKLQNNSIHLDANNKTQSIQLELIHTDKSDHIKSDVKKVSTKFMVQVRPNGFKYEVPISISLNEITLPEMIKVNSTKTSIHFAPSNRNDDTIEEIILMNPHSFNVKCNFKCTTLNNQIDLFFLVGNDEVEIKANASERVSVRYKQLIDHSDSIFLGNLKINAALSSYNIKLIAFSGKSRVIVDGVTQIMPYLDDFNSKLSSNNIRYYSFESLNAKNQLVLSNSETIKAFVKIIYLNDDASKVLSSQSGQVINKQMNKISFNIDSTQAQNVLIVTIDNHIFNYIFENIKENRIQSSITKKDYFDLDTLIYYDLFADYLQLNNLADSSTLKRLSEGHFANLTASFCTLNATTDNSVLISKSKIRPYDLLKFLKSQITYFMIQLKQSNKLQVFTQPPPVPRSINSCSKQSSRLSSTSSASTLKKSASSQFSEIEIESSWTMDRTEVYLNDRQDVNVILTNHTSRELQFKALYSTSCLELLPSSGCLNPKSQKVINIQLKKECWSKLPWVGSVTFICDKIQKDFRIFISSPSTSNLSFMSSKNTTSLSTGSLNSMCSSYLTNKTSASNYSLEQGTLSSDSSQLSTSIDTNKMTLTPLIVASFLNSNGRPSGCLSEPFNDKTSVKIFRNGNDGHVVFNQYGVLDASSHVDLIFTNPTKDYIKWKAYSVAPPILKCKQEAENDADSASNLMKSLYTVFCIKPSSGVIPAKSTQLVRIEFNPRKSYGLFTQHWEIDTRTEEFNSSANKDLIESFNCKLVLNGTLHALSNDQSVSNTLSSLTLNQQNSKRSLGPSGNSKASFRYSKENHDPIGDDSSNETKKKVKLKTNVIEFPDTDPGEVIKESIHIDNGDDKTINLQIIKLLAPFNCKHANVQVKAKHYLRLPIEFRPTQVGEFVDKVIIKTDSNDVPLTCVIRGKCKKTK